MEAILKDYGFTDEEIVIVRWQLNDYGDFYKSLIEAIVRADYLNIEKLRKGFPVEVGAIEKFKGVVPEGQPDFYGKVAMKLDKVPQFAGRF